MLYHTLYINNEIVHTVKSKNKEKQAKTHVNWLLNWQKVLMSQMSSFDEILQSAN